MYSASSISPNTFNSAYYVTRKLEHQSQNGPSLLLSIPSSFSGTESMNQYHVPDKLLRETYRSQDTEFFGLQESLASLYFQQPPVVPLQRDQEVNMADIYRNQLGMSPYDNAYWQPQLLQADISQLFPQRSYHMNTGDGFDPAKCGTLSQSRTSTIETDVSEFGTSSSWLSTPAKAGPSASKSSTGCPALSFVNECHNIKCFFSKCNQTFRRKTDLKRHLFSTHGNKNRQARRTFFCEICSKMRRASRYDVAQRHLRKCWSQHWDNLPFDMTQLSIDYKQQFTEQRCFYDQCMCVFDNKKQLQRHLFEVHGKSMSHKLTFWCSKCNQMKSFTRSETMEEHQRKCSGRP